MCAIVWNTLIDAITRIIFTIIIIIVAIFYRTQS